MWIVKRVDEKQWVFGKWMVIEKSILQFHLLFFQHELQLFRLAESFDGIFHNWKAIPKA